MENGLREKLDRVTNTIDEMKVNLHLSNDAPIEEVSKATDLRNLLNLYVQMEEPENKNGIWIQAEQSVEQILIDEGLEIMNQHYNYTNLPTMPTYTVSFATCVAIDNIVYVFGPGSVSSNYSDYILKIDIRNNTVTEIKDCGVNLSRKKACVVGEDVYLIGGDSEGQKLRKYNIVSGQFTELASCPAIPYPSSHAGLFLYNNSLYLTKVYDSNKSNTRDIWKYEIATDTWSYVNTYPYYQHSCGNQMWGSYIIYPLSDTSNHNNYTWQNFGYYNIDTNEFGWLKKEGTNNKIAISSTYCGATGSSSTVLGCIVDDTWYGVGTRGTSVAINLKTGVNTPIPADGSSSRNTSYSTYILVDNKILNVGGTKLNAICPEDKEYPKNSVVIMQGKNNPAAINTALFTLDAAYSGALLYPFFNAVLVNENGNIDYSKPVFYGNGTEWIRYKN
jgi:hypothetical protein